MLLPEKGVVTALLDTGSDINLVARELLDEDDKIRPCRTQIKLASLDHATEAAGLVTLTIVIKGANFTADFFVLPRLRQNVILGNSFFKRHKVSMCYSRRCISLGTQKRVTAYWNQIQRPQLEDVVLPTFDVDTPEEIRQVYAEFEDCFQAGLKQSTTISTCHYIPLKSSAVVHKRAYPMSPQKKQILYDQIKEMLQAGVIEPSTSPFSSPPVLVMRPEKKPRFCVDYRELNAITEEESTALPRITDALKGLSQAKVFTTLDLKSGYWQIPLAPKDAEKTAFTTPDGTAYQFRVMPFGLKNAPATFQRLMAGEVLTGLLHRFCCVYLDDVIIYSENMQEHAKHTHLVLERLREHELRISAEKCQIARTNLDFLGFTIDGGMVKPQEKHLKQVESFQVPRNRKQLQSFLGTCGWLREHIPNYSGLTAPLTELLKGPAGKWKWTKVEETAFAKVKDAVAKSKPLYRPNFEEEFILQTDASMEGMAAVLYQEEGPERKIISYGSAKFKPNERRLHVNEQECLALIWATAHFRPYLEDKPFTVRTDSRCLTWLNKFKDSRAKLTRWALQLQEFNFKIEHVKGTENQLPDLLSRQPEDGKYSAEPDNDRLLPPENTVTIESDEESHPQFEADVEEIGIDELYSKIAECQRKSDFHMNTCNAIEALKTVDRLGPRQEQLLREFDAFDGLLWRRNPAGDRLVVPKPLIPAVIHRFHDAEDIGHPGTAETVRRISEKFFFGTMAKTVSKYIGKCIICRVAKTQQKQETAPMTPRIPKFPWEMISMDLLGPFPEAAITKNRFVLVIEDVFSKWTEAFSADKFDSKDLERILSKEIFARYGPPKYLVSDNGSIFVSGRMEKMCEKQGIRQLFSAVRHQRANPVERRCQELKKVLRILLVGKAENQWENQLTTAIKILRSRINRATGHSPASIVLGYELPMPGEWKVQWNKFRRTQKSAHQRRRRNRKIRAKQLEFVKKEFPRRLDHPKTKFYRGQKVNLRNPAPGALSMPWLGPGEIRKVVSDVIYEVEYNGNACNLHVDDLRAAPEGNVVNYDLVDQIPITDDETSEDNDLGEPQNLARTLETDEESISSEKTAPTEKGNTDDGQGAETSGKHTASVEIENWSFTRPKTLKSSCLEAQKLAKRIESENRPGGLIFAKYDDLATKMMLHLDNFDLENSPTFRAARRQAIGQLELALTKLEAQQD